MNKNKIISDSDLKALAGLAASDRVISMHNQIATNTLCSILGVSDLVEHSVTGERARIINDTWIEPIDFPCDASTVVMKNRLQQAITGYTFEQHNNSARLFRIVDSLDRDALLSTDRVILDYTAGWTVQDTLTFTGLPSDDDTFVVSQDGTDTEYTFKTTPTGSTQIQIEATVDAQATSTAAKTGGDASGAVVTLPLGASATVDLSTVTLAAASLPEEFKLAVAYIAAGSIQRVQSSGDVSSYRVGSKQVVFRNPTDAQTVNDIVNGFLSKYQPIGIYA